MFKEKYTIECDEDQFRTLYSLVAERGSRLRVRSTNQKLTNQEVSEDVVLDIGLEDKIVGIEIMNASKRLQLNEILPISYGYTSSKEVKGKL